MNPQSQPNNEVRSELKLCPFCGASPRLRREKMFRIGSQSEHSDWEEMHYPATVYCSDDKCGIKITKSVCRKERDSHCNEYYKEAISRVVELWNRRVTL